MGDQSTLPTINFLSLNVCGFNRKLQCKEFINLLSLHDLIGLSETKTNECDATCNNLSGYSVFFKSQKSDQEVLQYLSKITLSNILQ
jgi:hypothetical protein